jgi:Na+/proline symporter
MIVMLAFVGYSGMRAIRASRKVRTASDFFSFGPDLDPSALRRAFQATNISFTTSFVSLYLFVSTQGYFTFATPICFCLGTLLYACFFLPRQITVLSKGSRYPELLAKATGSGSIRPWIAAFVLLSLWMFTFAEVQGLNIFLGKLFADVPILSQIVPMILVSSLAFYVSRNGYRATTSNDAFQMRIILLGALSVIALTFLTVRDLGLSKVLTAASQLENPFGSPRAVIPFFVETLAGFAFSQLLYYDNWQRLSFYAVGVLQAAPDDARSDVRAQLIRTIRKEYAWATAPVLFVLISPVLLGLASLSSGTSPLSIATLAAFLTNAWVNYPIVGPALVILSFAFMLSALLSTVESYVIAFVNCLIEDVLKIRLHHDTDERSRESRLEGVRILTALVAVSLVPFLLIQPRFDTLFIFLFYSANGFVGPLVFLTFRRQLSAVAVIGAIVIGFIYPLPVFFPQFANCAPYPGLVPVAISLILVGVTSKRISN